MAKEFSLEEALGTGTQATTEFSLEEALGNPPKGFLSNIGSLIFEGGERALGAAKIAPSVVTGDVGEDKAKLLAEELARPESVRPPELVEALGAFKDEAKAFEEAKGFRESVGPFADFMLAFGKQALTNPKGVAYLTAQSAAYMAPQIAGVFAGGKGAGLAAAPLGPQVAATAAFIGGIGGGIAAGAPLEIGSEFISRVGEALQERGLEPTEQNIATLLQDQAFVEQTISEARKKGTTTAAIDSAMTVGAGRFATGARRTAIDTARKELGETADVAKIAARADDILKARTTGQKVKSAVGRGAGAVGIDVTGGGVSEAAGQAAAYGEVDLEGVGLEMLGSLGGSAIEVPAAAYSTTTDALRGKARTDAAKILADEQKARADAEQARLDAEDQTQIDLPDLDVESDVEPTTLRETEPYVKPPSISGTRPDALLGERADPLAGAVTARREAAEPPSKIPLGDNYAFLQREKQRMLQEPSTPETKQMLQRIDTRLGEILTRDIEQRRADKEASKTSVFAQEELPPVESRDVVVGNLELDQLQAPVRPADQPLTGRDVKSEEKMRKAPPPVDDAQARLEQAEMDRRKFMRSKEAKQGNLMEYLKGKLALDEVSDIAPKGKGFEKLANEQGTYISELVSDGMLDEFLPPDQRAGQSNFDAQTAAETIKENLRNKNLRPFELQTQIRQLDEGVAAAELEAKQPSTAQFDLSEVEPGEAASVERSATDQEVGEATDIRYQRSTTTSKSIGKQQTQSVVDSVKAQWANAPEVVVAESMSDPLIPEAVRAHNEDAVAKGAKGKPKGFFYKGKAYILADSITSPNDAVETLFHESLGHFGLRGTFGPEMGKVLADVVKNRRADVEAKAKQYGLDITNEKDMLEAAEEVLAEIAQTKPGLSFVKRAIAVIRNFLRDLGLPFKMSNEDIIQKYILPARAFVERGEGRAVEGKPAAEPAAMREPAKSTEPEAKQEDADIRFQREATPEADAEPTREKPTRQNIFGEPVLGTWSITVDPKMELQDGLIYKMLDKNIDVKRIVEAVKKTGKEIATKWNPYLQEELYHGRTAEASKLFQDNEWLPLLQDMQKKDVTIGEFEKYLLNRHAEDYNKFVAERNKTRPEMQDGGSSVKTEDARKYLAGLNKETKAKYDELAKRIDGITKGTRQLLADTGYEKAETIKAWEETFPNYVPLMREEMDFDYNFGSFGTGRGFDVRRDFSRSAMGSKRNVVDIIGNVISARNNAIALTEKNRVAQAVYGLALEAPNPDFWMAINPDLAEVKTVDRIKQNIAKLMAKRADPNLTDDERSDLKSSFNAEYKKLKFAQTKAQAAIEKVREELIDLGIPESSINAVMQEPEQRILDPKKNEVVKRVNPDLRKNDLVLATRINGERRYVFFNPNDPRSKRAATALKNLDAQDLGTTLGLISKATRWMASVNTQYNPIFGPYNFLRDFQAGALQLSTTELAGQQKEIAKLIVPSMGAIYSSLRKRRKGETVDSDMAKLWKEFQKEGGQTGFRDNFSRTQDRTEAVLTEMEKLTEGKLKAGGRAAFAWLSDYNDSLENAVRLAAYKVAKDKFGKEGAPDAEAKQRAASLAKNLTVNFNRKGDYATQMGALYAFFNASMQGSARMIETLKGPMGRKIVAGGLLWGSIQALILSAAGFDDEEPREFVRSKNIIFPTGDGNYFAFPMPLGFHVIPGFSRIITEWTMSGFDDTARRVTDLTGLFLDAFNPVGNAGWSVQTVAPTVLDPFVALGENKDFTSKPISKEDMFSLNPTPGFSRAREGANFLTTAFSKFLNAASGGDEDRPGVISPTPEQIEYLIGQATGGVGREAIKLTTTIKNTITGEDLPPYKIPLYGRFFGETKSAAAESNKFYKNMKELNQLNNVVTGRRDRKEPLGDFFKENPEARLLPLANKTFKDVQELRKRRKALLDRKAPKASIEAVEKLITRRMAILNERVKALGGN